MTDKATPVQAGIDPLVAETIAQLDAAGDHYGIPMERTCATAAALLRSQAERIAALEVERDSWKEAALSDDATAVDLLKAAKADIAEAREALEKIGKTGTAAENYSGDRLSPEEVYMGAVDEMLSTAVATLSRLKPGEKGGGE